MKRKKNELLLKFNEYILGELISLREMNLTNNSIRNLPYEIGKLFRLQSLGLMGNPLPAEIYSIYTESNGLQKLLTYFLDSLPSSINGITKSLCLFVCFS